MNIIDECACLWVLISICVFVLGRRGKTVQRDIWYVKIKNLKKGPDVFRKCVFSGQFRKILRGFYGSLYKENIEAQRWKIKPFFCLCLRDFSRYSETPAVEMNRGSFFFFFFFTVKCTILILALNSAVFTDVLSEIFRLGSFAKKKKKKKEEEEKRNVLRHVFLRIQLHFSHSTSKRNFSSWNKSVQTCSWGVNVVASCCGTKLEDHYLTIYRSLYDECWV